MFRKKKNILVAMSGGVDSAVAAALLVKQGHNVTGAFMKQWSDSPDVNGVCTWKEDRRSAMAVAAHLGIELITLDFEKEYKQWVMEYMFEEYKNHRTPNPDVMCNVYIKFGHWLDEVRKRGFDAMATGHYARTRNGKLLRAKDENKDQTYFLHRLTSEQLKGVMFPLGRLKKPKVRKLAKKWKLPNADRPESMGICFVGEVPMKDFLAQRIDKEPGNIVTTDGTVIGEHDGLYFYTIGQRNIGVDSGRVKKQQGQNKPLYVIDKNVKENELVVGFADNPARWKTDIALEDIHWIDGHGPNLPVQCMGRLRHRQTLERMIFDGKSLHVKQKQAGVTPGQFAVLYKGRECLGGGVIS